MTENMIDEEYMKQLDKEYQELKEIAATKGLSVAEYLQQEAKKLLKE